MATAHNHKAWAIVLGLALVYTVADGAARHFGIGNPNHQPHRALLDGESSSVFDITQYGAVADDKTDNAPAMMKTWRAACDSGAPATMMIPKGTFITSPVVFQGPCKTTPINFVVEGTVEAVQDLSSYPDGMWMSFEILDGLVLTGSGLFNGRGETAWQYNDCKRNGNCQPLPDTMKLFRVNNAVVQHVTSLNSKYFHFHLHTCNNVTFYNVTITAPSNSPNTDGIHISNSKFINVLNTNIGTGDDCVSIGQGATNVTIREVFCGPGHGLSVGSLGKYKNENNVASIHVINCTLSKTTNGARIKTFPGSPPSLASDIRFEDIIIDDVENPVIIDQKYGSHQSAPSQVKISNVVFKNIRGTTTSDLGVNLMCSSIAPCEDVEISDIDLAYTGPKQAATFASACLNAKVLTAGTLNPAGCQ